VQPIPADQTGIIGKRRAGSMPLKPGRHLKNGSALSVVRVPSRSLEVTKRSLKLLNTPRCERVAA
jgi:hypothetical protein